MKTGVSSMQHTRGQGIEEGALSNTPQNRPPDEQESVTVAQVRRTADTFIPCTQAGFT